MEAHRHMVAVRVSLQEAEKPYVTPGQEWTIKSVRLPGGYSWVVRATQRMSDGHEVGHQSMAPHSYMKVHPERTARIMAQQVAVYMAGQIMDYARGTAARAAKGAE